MFGNLLTHVTFVDAINIGMFVAFSACYAYQLVYVLVVLLKKPVTLSASKNHRYAVLVAARNERAVIADLMHSIRAQDYPQELLDVFVIADNCTDDTATVALDAGATAVFSRTNTEKVGKGYALAYGISILRREWRDKGYEAYFVFDADNVLDKHYISEMNKVFDNGAKASTSYRNSKNFSSNWISAGYAVWFLREAKFLSQARLVLNSSCAISGTGFFIAADVIEKHDGWQWFLLTEDIEFSASSVLDGVRIAYCPTAVLYDEQPITFRDSWNQRFRWAKGFYQVFWHYGARLAKGMFTNPAGSRFACYDILMTVSPAMLISFIILIFNLCIVILGACGIMSTGAAVASSLSSVCFCLLNYITFMFFFGVLTTIVEWDSMRATSAQKIRAVFTFPLFMLTYIPIAFVALVKKAEWKPIVHSISVDVDEYSTGAVTHKAHGRVPAHEAVQD